MDKLKPGLNGGAKIVGSQFVKPITLTGSPHAEEAASKAMGLMGVPHVPVKAERAATGGWQVTSPALPVTNLGTVLPAHLDKHRSELINPHRLGQLNLAEFVMGSGDRHGGNYVHVPGQGVLSIDHGGAWHPSNAWWPRMDAGEPMPDYMGLRNNSEYWSEDPGDSAYGTFHFNKLWNKEALSAGQGHPNYAPIPSDTLDRILAHREQLEQLAYEGTHGLPEEERTLARLATRLRINRLEQDRPKNVGDLRDTHFNVIRDAFNTFRAGRK